ncbi:cation:proton antiporter, partial [Sutterella wadsworthensis]
MDHSLPLISTLVIAFSLALVFGFIAERVFRSPALVGYLLAGIAAGKYTPGVVADAALASQLSEIGVMLLMFGVGLHFSLKDLWSVKSVAVPGAVLQMTIATALGACFAHWFFDRHWAEAIVLGVSLSCASTVVLLKALDVRGKLTSPDGRIAVGWLVVEDIATVLILVLLPPFANLMMPGTPGASTRLANADILWMIGQTLFNAALFVVVMLVVGRRVLPWAMGQVARTGSRELFTLFVLAAAVGVAYGASEIFHVSFALGAFFAGMVMRESRFAHRAATESLPLQDAFSVLFFVGVGMLFDWHILLESPLEVLTVLLIILFGKSIGAFGLVYFMRYPLHTAMIAAVALAQIGEFSFILIGQAVELGLADMSTVNLVVAGAILSIALNPGLFWAEPHISRWLTSRFAWARRAAMRHAPYESLPADTEAEKLQGQAVVAGSGPLLDRLAVSLEESGIPVVAV